MSSKENKEKFWNFIKDVKVGMMTSQDGDDLRARPMHLIQNHYDGTLWFFTSVESGKIDEIEEDRAVCISFSDHSNNTYVSMSGFAKLAFDRELINEFWNPFVAAWFPEGKDDPSLALLEVKIHKGEYWDSKSNMFAQIYKVAKANLTDQEPDMGENKKFG